MPPRNPTFKTPSPRHASPPSETASTLSSPTSPTPSEKGDPIHEDPFNPEPPAKRIKYSPFPDDDDGGSIENQNQPKIQDRKVEFAAAYETREEHSSISEVSQTMEDEEMKDADARSEISLADEDEILHITDEETKHLLRKIERLELTIQMLRFKAQVATPKYEKSQAELQNVSKERDSLSLTNSKLSQDIQFLNQRLPKIREAEQLQRDLEAVTGRNIFLQMQVENLKREREDTVRKVVSLERELGGMKAQVRGRAVSYAELEKRTYLTSETVGGLGNGDGTRGGGEYIEGSFSIRKHRNHRALGAGRGQPTLVDWQGEVKKMTKEERDREMSALARKMQVLRLMDGKMGGSQSHLR